jgi:hypothetical protein
MAAIKRPVDESRNKKRITKVLPVDCVVASLPRNQSVQHHLMEGDSFAARTINISKTGLLVYSDYELDKNTLVDVALTLDDGSKRRIKLQTSVAWAKRNAAAIYGRWSMGLHIVKAKPADIEALHAYFESLS